MCPRNRVNSTIWAMSRLKPTAHQTRNAAIAPQMSHVFNRLGGAAPTECCIPWSISLCSAGHAHTRRPSPCAIGQSTLEYTTRSMAFRIPRRRFLRSSRNSRTPTTSMTMQGVQLEQIANQPITQPSPVSPGFHHPASMATSAASTNIRVKSVLALA